MLLRRRADRYASRYPRPSDVFLVIEVGETSVEFDRKVKAPLYARSGVVELWLVDLEQEIVTVYREPQADGYHSVQVLRRGGQLTVFALPHPPVAIADLLD